MLDIFQQFTFVIKQKKQHTGLNKRKTQIDIIDKSNKQKLNIYIYMRRNLQIIKNSDQMREIMNNSDQVLYLTQSL